jgi:hypothetical protein
MAYDPVFSMSNPRAMANFSFHAPGARENGNRRPMDRDSAQVTVAPPRQELHTAAQRRRFGARFAYRRISGVTEMPWSTTDAATVVSVIAINSCANESGRPRLIAYMR